MDMLVLFKSSILWINHEPIQVYVPIDDVVINSNENESETKQNQIKW